MIKIVTYMAATIHSWDHHTPHSTCIFNLLLFFIREQKVHFCMYPRWRWEESTTPIAFSSGHCRLALMRVQDPTWHNNNDLPATASQLLILFKFQRMVKLESSLFNKFPLQPHLTLQLIKHLKAIEIFIILKLK